MSAGSVLITGGTGFIGTHLARKLVAIESKVVLFDLYSNNHSVNDLKNKVTIVKGDVADFQGLVDVIKEYNVDSVIHTAAMLSVAAAVLVVAAKMIEDGVATFDDIDRAWKEHLGYIFLQFGPFGNIDHIGLNTITMAANYLAFVLEDEKFRPPSWLQEKVNAGDLDMKSGKGIYEYSKSPDDMRIERIRMLLELIQRRES
ncbi:MAG: 3-hydroxyacyl-CoA dehydrogenase family protein [Candidatus Thorarchaeota archaeon]